MLLVVRRMIVVIVDLDVCLGLIYWTYGERLC